MTHLFAPPPVTTIPIVGREELFPVHRVYCVGRNYVEHAQEMGFTGREPPFFFLKPADTVVVCPPDEEAFIPYPDLTTNFQHEVELVVAIGKAGSKIAAEQADEHIFGYAVGLDMTRRDLQSNMKKMGRPWCIGKAFDHSSPVGYITPKESVKGIESADIVLLVNGMARQSSNTSKMIWSIGDIIEQLSTAWTLQPGDLIFTGTPEGVAAVSSKDRLKASIDSLSPLLARIK